MSSVQEQIVILEKRLQNYKNNYDFAVKNNNKVRQTKYANIMAEVKVQIKQLERDIPLESNERLRDIIDGQNAKIDAINVKLEEATKKNEELEARINAFINPPKVIPPEETDLQTNVPHECPKCGRGGFKGSRGVAAHQRSGACKAAH